MSDRERCGGKGRSPSSSRRKSLFHRCPLILPSARPATNSCPGQRTIALNPWHRANAADSARFRWPGTTRVRPGTRSPAACSNSSKSGDQRRPRRRTRPIHRGPCSLPDCEPRRSEAGKLVRRGSSHCAYRGGRREVPPSDAFFGGFPGSQTVPPQTPQPPPTSRSCRSSLGRQLGEAVGENSPGFPRLP